MIYVYATLICMLAPLMYILSTAHKTGLQLAARDWRASLGMLCALLFATAFITGFFPPTVWKSGDINITPWLSLAAGIVGVPLFSFFTVRVARMHGDNALANSVRGICVVAVLAAGYMAYAAADNLLFWRDKSATGIVSKMLYSLSDVRCDSDYLAIRREGSVIRYRCPRNNLTLGTFMNEPFLPWPSYREGTSANLGHVMDEFEHQVQQLEQARREKKVLIAPAGNQ